MPAKVLSAMLPTKLPPGDHKWFVLIPCDQHHMSFSSVVDMLTTLGRVSFLFNILYIIAHCQ